MDKLTNLSLLHFPNNILTDECIDVLTKSIANKKIQELNLSNNKVGWVSRKIKTNYRYDNNQNTKTTTKPILEISTNKVTKKQI